MESNNMSIFKAVEAAHKDVKQAGVKRIIYLQFILMRDWISHTSWKKKWNQ